MNLNKTISFIQNEIEIPIPNFTSDIMELIKTYCQYYIDNDEKFKKSEEKQIKAFMDQIQKRKNKYLQNLNSYERSMKEKRSDFLKENNNLFNQFKEETKDCGNYDTDEDLIEAFIGRYNGKYKLYLKKNDSDFSASRIQSMIKYAKEKIKLLNLKLERGRPSILQYKITEWERQFIRNIPKEKLVQLFRAIDFFNFNDRFLHILAKTTSEIIGELDLKSGDISDLSFLLTKEEIEKLCTCEDEFSTIFKNVDNSNNVLCYIDNGENDNNGADEFDINSSDSETDETNSDELSNNKKSSLDTDSNSENDMDIISSQSEESFNSLNSSDSSFEEEFIDSDLDF